MYRSTEHDHIEDSLPAKLQRMRKFGKLKLPDFKDLITPEDYKICEEVKSTKKTTWYPLTIDVFIKFLYSVRAC